LYAATAVASGTWTVTGEYVNTAVPPSAGGTALAMWTAVRLVQPYMAESPMLVTLAGMSMVVKELYVNAYVEMLVTVDGR
jgi:hypothetical protein